MSYLGTVDRVILDHLASILRVARTVLHCSMSTRNCRQLRRRQGIVVTILVGKAIGKAIERSPVTSATLVLFDAPQNQEELESEFRGVATVGARTW